MNKLEHYSVGIKALPALLSAEGIQQGNPLGPFLFNITIQPLIQKLHSDFTVFYLRTYVDDGRIRASMNDVLADLQLMEEATTLSLNLYIRKLS